MKLPDIQQLNDTRNIALRWVGIENVILPFQLLSKGNIPIPIQGEISLAVGLPHNYKGTHMSRFVEVIEEYSRNSINNNEVFGGQKIKEVLSSIKNKLNAETAMLEMGFIYFVQKAAPVSKQIATMDYPCTFRGELDETGYHFFITVKVPLMNVCPCSKEISKYGAHNQRGYAYITVESNVDDFTWIEDIINIGENAGSSPVYPILKRVDEKFVTETSYENPKFVEDVTRDIVLGLRDKKITKYKVKVHTIESIHNHQAFAIVDSGEEL